MPATRNMRAALALLTFAAAAAAAGWFTVRVPEDRPWRGPLVPVSENPNGDRKSPPRIQEQGSGSSPGAALATLERALTLALDPAAEAPCTGERLTELCLSPRPDQRTGPNSANSYARRWAQQAPQEMFAWFQKRGKFTLPASEANTHHGFLGSLFSDWVRRDAGAALAAALQCTGKQDQAGALTTILRELRRTDPARAAAIAAEHLSFFAGERLTGFNASADDFKDTWAFLRALPPGKDRGTVLAQYFDDLIRYQRKDCAQLWQETPEEVRREMVAGGFTGLYPGKANPAPGAPAALEGLADFQRAQVEQTGDAKLAHRFLQTGARDWAERDPAAAIAWAQQHLKGEQRVTGTAGLFAAGAAKQFDATLQAWQALPDGMLRARAAGNLAAGAPAERKAEVDALLGSLSAADRGVASVARQSAATALRDY